MRHDTDINAHFPSTAWSAIVREEHDPAERARRMERLCKIYWRPVFSVVLLFHGQQDADARDLTQAFFQSLIQRRKVEKYDRSRGRFRTFIRHALANFIRDTLRVKVVPTAAEGVAPDPGAELDRQWLKHLLENAIEESRPLLARHGHAHAIDIFLKHDYGDEPTTYADLAREFGITEAQVQKRLTHARDCVREVVRERVRETVANPEDYADELRFVFCR